MRTRNTRDRLLASLLVAGLSVSLASSLVLGQGEGAAAEESEPTQGELFESTPEVNNDLRAAAVDTVAIEAGQLVTLDASDQGVVKVYKTEVSEPAILTVMIDCSSRTQLRVFGPNGEVIQSFSDMQGLADFGGPVGAGVPQVNQGSLGSQIYRVDKPGEYIIRLSILDATDDQTHLGTSLIRLPVQDDPGAIDQAGGGGGQEKLKLVAEAVDLSASRWTAATMAAGQAHMDFVFTPEAEGLFVFFVRTQFNNDVMISLYLKDAEAQGQLLHLQQSDDDPLGEFGSESVTLEAKAERTYIFRIANLSEQQMSLQGYIRPLDQRGQ